MKKILIVLGALALMGGVSAAHADDEAMATPAASEVSQPSVDKGSDDAKADPISNLDPISEPIAIIPISEDKNPKEDPKVDPIDIVPIGDPAPISDLWLEGDKGKDKDPKPAPEPEPTPVPSSTSGGGSNSGGSVVAPAVTAIITPTVLEAPIQALEQSASNVKAYGDGTLLRNTLTKRIYVVKKGKLSYIQNLTELRKFSGKKIINLSPELIASYLSL